MMKQAVMNKLASFFDDTTRQGLFPVVAYGLDDDHVLALTTNIPDLPLAMRILGEATRDGYNLGRYLPRERIEKIADENPHFVVISEQKIEGLGDQDNRDIGRVVATFGAPLYEHKAFALVDITGFSALTTGDQLSQLYSLVNVVKSATRRAGPFCKRLRVSTNFGKTSTGDGFYFWHDEIGGGSDIATFMLLLFVMIHSEYLRSSGFPMQLKASFVIDSAFMLYDAEPSEALSASATNAVGPATNSAYRILGQAAPSQILLGDFERPGQGEERIQPQRLVAQANELFRVEREGAGNLQLDPPERMRVVDKHSEVRYCWNLCGEAPNRVGASSESVAIGLRPDPAKELDDMQFHDEPA